MSGLVFWMSGLVFWASGLVFECLDLYLSVWTCILGTVDLQGVCIREGSVHLWGVCIPVGCLFSCRVSV